MNLLLKNGHSVSARQLLQLWCHSSEMLSECNRHGSSVARAPELSWCLEPKSSFHRAGAGVEGRGPELSRHSRVM
jgi:hypothetical protein